MGIKASIANLRARYDPDKSERLARERGAGPEEAAAARELAAKRRRNLRRAGRASGGTPH